MNRIKMGILAVVAPAALFGAWVAAPDLLAMGDDDGVSQRVLAPAVVRTTIVDTGAAARGVRLSGVTRAKNRAELAFTLSGRLDERPIEVGDSVVAGQALGRLDRQPLRNAVSSARASVARARAQLAQQDRNARRTNRLIEAEAVSQAEHEDAGSGAEIAAATRDAAAAELAEARRRLREAVLRAPFDAVVSEVFVQPGEFVQAGRSVVALSGEGGLELEVELPEGLLQHLKVGAGVDVVLPRQDARRIRGTVTAIAHASMARGRLFAVIVSLDDPDVVPGMTAELDLAIDSAASLAVPVEAVINPGGGHPSVFRVRDAVVERVEIRIDDVASGTAWIGAGLEAGDEVVTSGHTGLVPGDAVEVRR